MADVHVNNGIPLLAEIKSAVRKSVFGWFVGVLGTVALAAFAGWMLFLDDWLSRHIGVPYGAVIAIDDSTECQTIGSNWRELKEAKGRFLLTEGPSVTTKDLIYSRGKADGSEAYSLTAVQLPQHKHWIPWANGHVVSGGDSYSMVSRANAQEADDGWKETGFNNEPNPRETNNHDSIVPPKPYSVMPPYYTVKLCKKEHS